ncbi:MAG: GNAT family N-acetyltransferase [Candidatus Promineofilum sp.]|jgi:GNAT superfamily N-acetyltransferase|nr:GNAT family N-acetyltransferase [Promineifilum sp.]
MIEVKPLIQELLPDVEALFNTSRETHGCWCMWFLIPYKEYKAGGSEGNRQRFIDLMAATPFPLGLLAYRAGEVVGWCATGPRSRFARALNVPSFKGRDPSEDDSVWLTPCFYVRKDARREGVSRALLEAAVALARQHGATAIEGFPFATGVKVGRESMVAVEPLFAACGFVVSRRPLATRVVVRRELGT